MEKKFEDLISSFKETIADYQYYVNFGKVNDNVKTHLVELNILNSLIGSKNIEYDFNKLIEDYPKTLLVIPLLLAVRRSEIKIYDSKLITFDFYNKNLSNEDYLKFMRKTGLFDLLENSRINSLVDYLTGVEVGLDSNARKNRTGTAMENIVESYLIQTRHLELHKEMNKVSIKKRFAIDIDRYINETDENFIASKRFDFVIKTSSKLYLIETNFYSSGGSKLNETARSFKSLGKDLNQIENVDFIWITDGAGWLTTKNNLKEAFDVIPHLYNIADLENGKLKEVII